MEARIGTLDVGTSFETLLTGRRGLVVTNHAVGGVGVRWAHARGGLEVVWLHPDVRVGVVDEAVLPAYRVN